MPRFSEQDKQFMKRALALARKNRSKKSSEPKIGAVLVSGNRVVAEESYKSRKGFVLEDEVFRMLPQTSKLKELTVYITKEPSTLYSESISPLDALLLHRSVIKRVVIAEKDHHPLVNGFGIELLSRAGIQVDFGVMQNEAQELNKRYGLWARKQRYVKPFVKVAVATSIDGKITDKSPRSEDRISTREDLKLRDENRAFSDAVIVGGNTFLYDDPSLLITSAVERKRSYKKKGFSYPFKVVVIDSIDRTLKVNSNFFNEEKTGPIRKIFFTTTKTSRETIEKIKKASTFNEVFVQHSSSVKMEDVLRVLASFGVKKALIEGGGTLNFNAINEGIVDEIEYHIRSIVLGGAGAVTSVEGDGFDISKAKNVFINSIAQIDSQTVVMNYRFKK